MRARASHPRGYGPAQGRQGHGCPTCGHDLRYDSGSPYAHYPAANIHDLGHGLYQIVGDGLMPPIERLDREIPGLDQDECDYEARAARCELPLGSVR